MPEFESRDDYLKWKEERANPPLSIPNAQKPPSYPKNQVQVIKSSPLGRALTTAFASFCVLSVFGSLAFLVPGFGGMLGKAIFGAAVLVLIVGPFLNRHGNRHGHRDATLKGPCPYCSSENTVVVGNLREAEGVDCRVCKKRFVVKDRQFLQV